ncbi:hypothetical protein [Nocardioides acrostichi]|uniref:Uncharacterized protein n=1 Tax=Nocardioides acrostichi TaxID=2784339 RepID=A0A930Y7S7_9ACTN|nr:hypothetical protein [Nocardioides acrostichi]MBF4163745.1 hypothetical protein [Nocardioides acrostichi]
MNDPQLPPTTLYRLDPRAAAGVMGPALVLLAVVVLAVTLAVAATGGPPDLIIVVVALGLIGIFTLGWWLRARAWVLRVDDDGYTVRLIRKAGVKHAAWSEVQELATASPREIPVVVLHLVDGGTTTIPVQILATDREQFVRDLGARLNASQRRPR